MKKRTRAGLRNREFYYHGLKLELFQFYLQLHLDDVSVPYVSIYNHQGLYSYTRLPFGVALARSLGTCNFSESVEVSVAEP